MPGVYPNSRLDDCRHNHNWRGRSHSLPLDLDSRAAWYLANPHGLLDCTPRLRARIGDTSTSCDTHSDDWRCCRRVRRSLSFIADCCCGPCGLDEIRPFPCPTGRQRSDIIFSFVKGSELDLCVRAPNAIVASQILGGGRGATLYAVIVSVG